MRAFRATASTENPTIPLREPRSARAAAMMRACVASAAASRTGLWYRRVFMGLDCFIDYTLCISKTLIGEEAHANNPRVHACTPCPIWRVLGWLHLYPRAPRCGRGEPSPAAVGSGRDSCRHRCGTLAARPFRLAGQDRVYPPGRRRCSACRRWRPGAVARARQWAAPSGGSSGHHRDLHGGGTVCVSSCRNSRIGSLLSPAVLAASGPVLLGCLQAKVPMSSFTAVIHRPWRLYGVRSSILGHT